MTLKKYDNKCVRIIDTDDNIFEGNCIFNNKEYNEHEYGRNEYSMLEELIINSDVDFIEDALEMCNEVEKDRLILCLSDKKNIDKNRT